MIAPLHINIAVANRIFSSVKPNTAPQTLLGALVQTDRQTGFIPASDENLNLDENAMPVYLQQPADGVGGRYLLVLTGAKGVLEIRACQLSNGEVIDIPIIT